MSILKCKMCGGTVEFENGATVGTCDSCGTKQTLPRLDDDRKANLYDRANHFRMNNDYDRARSIYEQILDEDNTDAESYWSLILCKYGIEYVEDPTTHKRVPTINRMQFTSVIADEDYKKALEYADIEQKIIYEEEAKAIDEIQKGILEISQKEEPFDVFICYKETDNSGRRTQDSVLANDLYHQLTQEGFKVFFSRITLEDKLGTAYEPYIFAALNSAKVMVVLGTKSEYFNAVWVKNEWSRYLAMIKQGEKKVLIPAYKDMDPYDLPDDFSHLQAQDMTKLGFMQDLIRGIKKIIGESTPHSSVQQTIVTNTTSANITALLKRGRLALEDEEWDRAKDFYEEVLNQDAECAEAYLGLAMAGYQVDFDTIRVMTVLEDSIGNDKNYIKACRFAKGELKEQISRWDSDRNGRIEIEEKEKRLQELEEAKRLDEEEWRISNIKAQLENNDIDESLFSDDQLTRIHELESELEDRQREQEQAKSDLDAKQAELEVVTQEYNERKRDIDFSVLEKEQEKEKLSSLIEQKKAYIDKLGLFKKKEKEKVSSEIDSLSAEVERINTTIKNSNEELSRLFVPVNNAEKQVELSNSRYTSVANECTNTENSILLYKKTSLTKELMKMTIGVGETVHMGRWPQENEEKIEWIVLENKGDKYLLLSKNAIDARIYNEKYDKNETPNWETCSLRKWMNDELFINAFDEIEQGIIAASIVPLDEGKEIIDRLFALGADEVRDLLYDYKRKHMSVYDDIIKCKPTKKAIENLSLSDLYEDDCPWWLRSTSLHGRACVFAWGRVELQGYRVNSTNGVRPALWIDLGE